MMPAFLSNPAWVAVVLSSLALIPHLVRLVYWMSKRWQEPKRIKTQSMKDHATYVKLLDQYENYLNLLEDLIIIRSQVEAGSEEYTLELELEFVDTRDSIFHKLERSGERETQMGIFQKLDVLEGRNIGLEDQQDRRAELDDRQAKIERHPLFVGR